MIEKVEELDAELNPRRLGNSSVLMNREVKVIQSWPMEEVAAGVAQSAEGFSREAVGIKEVVALYAQRPCWIDCIRNRTGAGIERLNGSAVEIGAVEAPI